MMSEEPTRIRLVAPIDRLPTELFREILKLLSKPYRRPYKCDITWLVAATICRSWRAQVLAFPNLWAVINLRKGVSWLRLCLDRSGASPLDVFIPSHLTRDEPNVLPSESPFHEMIQILLPFSPRIRHLQLCTWYSWPKDQVQTLLRALGSSQSNLETLDYAMETTRLPIALSVSFPADGALWDSWAQTKHPISTLRILHLRMIILKAVDIPDFPNLTTLRLEHCRDVLGISHLLVLVAHCPELGWLALNDMSTASDSSNYPALDTVVLPKLRHFEAYLVVDMMRLILTHVVIPSTANIILHVDTYHEFKRATLFNIIPSIFPQTCIANLGLYDAKGFRISAKDRDPLEVKVNIYRSSFTPHGTRSQIKIRISDGRKPKKNVFIAKTLQAVAAVLSSSPIDFVDITIGPRNESHKGWLKRIDWFQFLAHLPFLQYLGCNAPDKLAPLLTALHGTHDAAGVQIPCPHLRHIRLRVASVKDAAATLLERSLLFRADQGVAIRELELVCGDDGIELDAATIRRLAVHVDVVRHVPSGVKSMRTIACKPSFDTGPFLQV